ncbi:MAG: hypothetical protein J0I12_11320 [Candidatus Eremiobacteraeota bacterium]|nr:hypothetical protein [Candidatus Eremiobacteraeota bacterium]
MSQVRSLLEALKLATVDLSRHKSAKLEEMILNGIDQIIAELDKSTAPAKSAFEHTIETVLTRRLDELEQVVERLHRNVVGTQAELDETRKRLEQRWNTCEAESNHLDGVCSQVRDLATRCHEIESRQTSEEDLHRGAVTLGGFDGRLCRIERKLERLAEVIASK